MPHTAPPVAHSRCQRLSEDTRAPSSARGCPAGWAAEPLRFQQPAGGAAGGSAGADRAVARGEPARRMLLRLGGGQRQLRASSWWHKELLRCEVGKAPERQFAVSQLLWKQAGSSKRVGGEISPAGKEHKEPAQGICPLFLWLHFPQSGDFPRWNRKARGKKAKSPWSNCVWDHQRQERNRDWRQLPLRTKQSKFLFCRHLGCCSCSRTLHSVNTSYKKKKKENVPACCSEKESDPSAS